MSINKFLASEYGVKVLASGVWYTVSGLNSITYAEDAEDVDITDFDGDGWGATMPGIRSASIELEGFRLADLTTGSRDPGQKQVERAARQKGFNGRRLYQLYIRSDEASSFIQFNGYAKNGEFGGGLNTADPWNASILMDGIPTISGLFNADA